MRFASGRTTPGEAPGGKGVLQRGEGHAGGCCETIRSGDPGIRGHHTVGEGEQGHGVRICAKAQFNRGRRWGQGLPAPQGRAKAAPTGAHPVERTSGGGAARLGGSRTQDRAGGRTTAEGGREFRGRTARIR